jgi:cytochrome b561
MTNEKYSKPAVIFHWTVAVLIALQIGLGFFMEDLPKGPERSSYFAVHKSLGITTFALIVLRIGWRLRQRPPGWPESMAKWQRLTAQNVHRFLYVAMVGQPVSGYLSSSFSGYPTNWFGLPLPQWGWKDAVLNELFNVLHTGFAVALIGLLVIHIGAALRHAVARSDRTFRRMLF